MRVPKPNPNNDRPFVDQHGGLTVEVLFKKINKHGFTKNREIEIADNSDIIEKIKKISKFR